MKTLLILFIQVIVLSLNVFSAENDIEAEAA
jgi:hypothetical protein